MMTQLGLYAVANEHLADLRDSAAAESRASQAREPRPSVRARTGWILVGLGLRLVTRTAGSMQSL